MAMNSGINVNEGKGKQFAFDLNVEASDETFDLNVKVVDATIDLNVETVDINVETGDGNVGGNVGINVQGVDGNVGVNVETGDGNVGINVEGVDGNVGVNVETVDGNVGINVEDGDGNIGINGGTVDGIVDINVEVADYNSDLCSICHEPLVNNSDDHRTLVTLKCGHTFHLDCIGSAFNAKSFMECPYCRNIEPGQWRLANSHSNVEEWIVDDDEDEEENGLGFFTGLFLGTELCPFEGLGRHYSPAGPCCFYVECSFPVPISFDAAEVTRSLPVDPLSNLSSAYPIFPRLSLPSNSRTFWNASEPGVMRVRHYTSHPYSNHGPLVRSEVSMVNAPMARSDPSSSTMQLNRIHSSFGNLSAPVSQGHMFMYFHEQPDRGTSDSRLTPYGPNQLNSIGFNPFTVWQSETFLEPAQRYHIEREFYRLIYGGNNNNGNERGSDSHGGLGSDGNSGDRGNDNFGGNGDGNEISGRTGSGGGGFCGCGPS